MFGNSKNGKRKFGKWKSKNRKSEKRSGRGAENRTRATPTPRARTAIILHPDFAETRNFYGFKIPRVTCTSVSTDCVIDDKIV